MKEKRKKKILPQIHRLSAVFLAVNCIIYMTACGAASETINTAKPQEDALQEETAPNDAAEEKQAKEDGQQPEGEKLQEEENDTKPEASSVTPMKLSDNLYDFQISIDGTVYQFPMWYSDFEALGWQYDGDNTDTLSNNQYVGIRHWKKDGVSVHTEFANKSMKTVPFSDSMVSGISMDRDGMKSCGWEILLPNGIKWGVSNVDDIIAAYGVPTSDYDGSNYYKMIYQCDFLREICLYVYKDSGVLEQIEIENIVELEDVYDSKTDNTSVSNNDSVSGNNLTGSNGSVSDNALTDNNDSVNDNN